MHCEQSVDSSEAGRESERKGAQLSQSAFLENPSLKLFQARPLHSRCPFLLPPFRSIDSNPTRQRKYRCPEPNVLFPRFVLSNERRNDAARSDDVRIRIGENNLPCARGRGGYVNDSDLWLSEVLVRGSRVEKRRTTPAEEAAGA